MVDRPGLSMFCKISPSFVGENNCLSERGGLAYPHSMLSGHEFNAK